MDKEAKIKCSIYTQIKPCTTFIKNGLKKTFLKMCHGCYIKVHFALFKASTITYYYRLLNVSGKLLLN